MLFPRTAHTISQALKKNNLPLSLLKKKLEEKGAPFIAVDAFLKGNLPICPISGECLSELMPNTTVDYWLGLKE